MHSATLDSIQARCTLQVGDARYDYFSLDAVEKAGFGDISRLPVSLKVLLENLLRHEDGRSVTVEHIRAAAGWLDSGHADVEVAYRPTRILLQDFTGVPAIVDLAAMRQAMADLGGDPQRINPLNAVDLVIDHSVSIDAFGSSDAFAVNVEWEFERNRERYEFLRWGAEAFANLRVVPPGTGICHQVNLEYLASTVCVLEQPDGTRIACPDTVVGTDSHTTMVNALAVLGWGVGGIEAEAAMLGQPVSMLFPDVVGVELTGQLPEGTTATDLVLTVTEMLRSHGVVGKFVEFFGDGLDALTLPDRATLANMAPEYGATCGFFPIDAETCAYLRFTGRDEQAVALVQAYARAQGMWRDASTPAPRFSETLRVDLAAVEPSLAGPKRPQDRVRLSQVAATTRKTIAEYRGEATNEPVAGSAMADMVAEGGNVAELERPVGIGEYRLEDGDVVIAAITSCTNTSNPSVLVAAGLLARNARRRGLRVKPWVKTSLAPGSQVVREYLQAAGLQADLDALGFNIVGFGCTTCIGNSGPLPEDVAKAVDDGKLLVGAVLSGNRNFEGRVHPQVRANFLASPPLVVAYALAGSLKADISRESLGTGEDGEAVYLRDIWPDSASVAETVRECLSAQMFRACYANVLEGTEQWREIEVSGSETYAWSDASTYVKQPNFFTGMPREPAPLQDVEGARALLILGDSVTTDHISPAGSIPRDGPAGVYLSERQVRADAFNSFGSRRGNHEVMVRGTFANIRIRNQMLDDVEGGYTVHQPSGEQMSIHDAAMRYADEGVPLVVVAGREYGTGSSRDWAAKGTALLGVKAVIVESYERIHRSNLIGMGILPLQFEAGASRETLQLDGSELWDLSGIATGLQPRSTVQATLRRADGGSEDVPLLCRIDTLVELDYYLHGGILQYVIRDLLQRE